MMNEELPEGWRKIVDGVYYNEKMKEIWVEGSEPDEDHDCDGMGCSSCNHWVFKADVKMVFE